MTARLPTPGSDDGVWGTVLNDFLDVEHNPDGTLKRAAQIDSAYTKPSGGIPKSDLAAAVQASLTTADAQNAAVIQNTPVSNTPPLDGQVLSYSQSGLMWGPASLTAAIPSATTSTKGIVQLAGDLAGTAAAPTVPGLAAKADDSAVVHNTGAETVAGVKTFMSNPAVPTPVGSTDAANKAYVDSATSLQLTWVNVKTLGAVGDFNNDDTSALNDAIANYNVVYVPAGHYKITSVLNLTDVTIIGDGAEVTIIEQTNTSSDGLAGVNRAYVRISGVQLKGPASGTGTGLNMDGSSVSWYVSLEDVRFDSWGAHGVYGFNVVSSFKNVLAMNNGLHGFTFDGLSSGAAGTSVSLYSCYARNNGKAGYYIFNMTYCSLVGCASDLNGISYSLDTCASIALTGCGAESPTNNGQTNYPGIGYKISDCSSVVLNSCYLAVNLGVGYWITGSSVDVTLIDPHEVLPSGTATSSITVDSGCRVQLIGESLSTPKSLTAGTTTQIGATDKSSTFSGNVTVGGNLTISGIGQSQFVTKAADQSVSNTTMTIDTDLTVPLAAGCTYTIELHGIYTAASGGDIKLSWGTLPAGSNYTWSGASSVSGAGSVFSGAVTDIWTGSGSTQKAFSYSGILINPTNAGTLQFEFAQNTSNGTATIMKAGSWMRVTRVA